jgi:hypothetical protein
VTLVDSIAFEMLFGGSAEISYPERSAPRHGSSSAVWSVQEQAFLLPNAEVLTLLILLNDALE